MEDVDIIGLYWAREERAISESDRKYGGLCRGVARRVLSSPEDGEECVSDTWLRAWNAMPPQRPSYLGAFFARLTRNLALDRYRRLTAEKRGGGEPALALSELEDCVSGGSMEEALDRRALAEALNGFLYSLKPMDRALFLRRYWSLEETAALAKRYGVSVSALHTRLHRLQGRLRAYLEREGIAL